METVLKQDKSKSHKEFEKLLSEEKVNKGVSDFKAHLEKEFVESKNYNPELKWFDGVWSRFVPSPVKDRRGVSGVSK
jgi:2-oxoglutarate dehydrogenase complex dehydrogenase (E1) component-like enzyme